ncbi:MAG: multiheme c-type cytochrome [Acidobacteriota bacterium]
MTPEEKKAAAAAARAAAGVGDSGSDNGRRAAPKKKRRYVPAVGPRLQKVLAVVFGLFALLSVNAAYLVGVTLTEWWTGQTYQNWFYQLMFLAHLVLGLVIVVPVIVFGVVHMRNTYDRRKRRAVYLGYALFTTALILMGSGIVLTRLEGIIVVKDETIRAIAYWAHVITPIMAAWLFVLHRLAGKKIKWKVGARWAMVAASFAVVMVGLQMQDPRSWNVEGPASGEQYFFPSLARTATGDFIPAEVLQNDQYCMTCHEDTHRAWEASVHRFSSFNNPPYLFSVRETRMVSQERSGNVQAARFCAGCHDPVVFFSGRFDDPNFDDVNDPTGKAGITCTVCHSITNVNSVRGNSDYTIEEPIHYPFAFSQNAALQWINGQLIKAKPEFHKKTFLKPLHSTPEFCGTCHKVHLPEELNNYKWLRGQNHYDAYHLSGVSGHGITSFYYPPKAQENCNGCHMPLEPSNQFAAKQYDDSGQAKIHNHQFPSANTGIPHLLGMPDWVNDEHRAFNEGVMRLDIFGVKAGGTIDGELTAPLRPAIPALNAGDTYLLETVIRTLKMGHMFTQGTADSNEIWMDITVRSGDRIIGRSGGLEEDGTVDPWSHFVNAYVLDRDGNRIDRRNAQDIFVPLYNHQIPPGAADVIHYRLQVPEDVRDEITVEAKLQYRKFDTTYLQYMYGADYRNDLPVMLLAEDSITFPVVAPEADDAARAGAAIADAATREFPLWQRWNDYGIALLRKGGKSKGELRQAEAAFAEVEKLGRPDGPLNLARVYIAQGTVQDKAIDALGRAASYDPPAPPWSVAWFTGMVNKQNGFLDEAIANFEGIVNLDSEETRERGFDFSQDYRLLNELGQTIFERAKQERGEARKANREAFLTRAEGWFQRALVYDPENASAHFNLDLIYKQLGDKARAETHFNLYRTYKPDDNARDRAIAIHRANNPAADHAAEAIVIYDLQREDAPMLAPGQIGPEAGQLPPIEILRAEAVPALPQPNARTPFVYDPRVGALPGVVEAMAAHDAAAGNPASDADETDAPAVADAPSATPAASAVGSASAGSAASTLPGRTPGR